MHAPNGADPFFFSWRRFSLSFVSYWLSARCSLYFPFPNCSFASVFSRASWSVYDHTPGPSPPVISGSPLQRRSSSWYSNTEYSALGRTISRKIEIKDGNRKIWPCMGASHMYRKRYSTCIKWYHMYDACRKPFICVLVNNNLFPDSRYHLLFFFLSLPLLWDRLVSRGSASSPYFSHIQWSELQHKGLWDW